MRRFLNPSLLVFLLVICIPARPSDEQPKFNIHEVADDCAQVAAKLAGYSYAGRRTVAELSSIFLQDIGTTRIRYGVDSPQGRRQLAQLEKVVRALRCVDQTQKKKKPNEAANFIVKGGYEFIRVAHGYPRRSSDWCPNSQNDLFARVVSDADLDERFRRGCLHEPDQESDPELFLLWHRAFVAAFEVTARAVLKRLGDRDADRFAIPYWNWWPDAMLPEAFRCPANSLCEGLADRDELDIRYPLYDPARSLAANVGDVFYSFDDSPDVIFAKQDWTEFASEIRAGWHNLIHQQVGTEIRAGDEYCGDARDMGVPNYAVRDPVFWVHHSFVDLLLSEWAARQQAANPMQKSQEQASLSAAWSKAKYGFPVRLFHDDPAGVSNDQIVLYEAGFEELYHRSNPAISGVDYEPWRRQPPLDLVHALMSEKPIIHLLNLLRFQHFHSYMEGAKTDSRVEEISATRVNALAPVLLRAELRPVVADASLMLKVQPILTSSEIGTGVTSTHARGEIRLEGEGLRLRVELTEEIFDFLSKANTFPVRMHLDGLKKIGASAEGSSVRGSYRVYVIRHRKLAPTSSLEDAAFVGWVGSFDRVSDNFRVERSLKRVLRQKYQAWRTKLHIGDSIEIVFLRAGVYALPTSGYAFDGLSFTLGSSTERQAAAMCTLPSS